MATASGVVYIGAFAREDTAWLLTFGGVLHQYDWNGTTLTRNTGGDFDTELGNFGRAGVFRVDGRCWIGIDSVVGTDHLRAFDLPALSNVYIGGTRIDSLYVGSNEVTAAYVGSTKVFG